MLWTKSRYNRTVSSSKFEQSTSRDSSDDFVSTLRWPTYVIQYVFNIVWIYPGNKRTKMLKQSVAGVHNRFAYHLSLWTCNLLLHVVDIHKEYAKHMVQLKYQIYYRHEVKLYAVPNWNSSKPFNLIILELILLFFSLRYYEIFFYFAEIIFPFQTFEKNDSLEASINHFPFQKASWVIL